MAKIHLKGNLSYEVTNDQAKKAQEIWEMPGIRLINLNNGTISFKSSEIKAIALDDADIKGYDLRNEHDRYLILGFQTELNGRPFEKYCYDKGYIFNKEGHYDYFVNAATVVEYNEAREQNKALEKLLAYEHEEQKRLHIIELTEEGKTVCQERTESKERCMYCYPWNPLEYRNVFLRS